MDKVLALKKINSFLVYLDELSVEMCMSELKPNLVFINKEVLMCINQYLPDIVKNNVLEYNGMELEVVSICDSSMDIALSYGYGYKLNEIT